VPIGIIIETNSPIVKYAVITRMGTYTGLFLQLIFIFFIRGRFYSTFIPGLVFIGHIIGLYAMKRTGVFLLAGMKLIGKTKYFSDCQNMIQY
jgi:hypothetical protein